MTSIPRTQRPRGLGNGQHWRSDRVHSLISSTQTVIASIRYRNLFVGEFCNHTRRWQKKSRSVLRRNVFTHGNHPYRRTGLTLLEIVLALAIFFGGITALSQLAWNGSRSAIQSQLRTQATIRCETKLNEILAGAEAMQSNAGAVFPEDSHWTWDQVVTPTNQSGLLQIDITVHHRGNNSMANVSVTLRRWVRPLSLFAQAAAEQRAEDDEKAKP